MRVQQKFAALFAAVFILSGSFPVYAAETDHIMEEISLPETTVEPEDESDFPIPDEAPAFDARIEFRTGYTVIGTFTDFTPDITLIQTLYSLDGENWETGTGDWNLFNLGTDDEDKLKELQNQPCLFQTYEPLKSYIAGEIDCFYLKLRITRQNGISYETQPVTIERGSLQPIPEGTSRRAMFSSDIVVREPDPAAPYRHRKYARYQLTVSSDATAEEVSALLPDTLPVEVQLDHGPDFIAIGIVDCPVTWKALSLPPLIAGESITIADAAEEIFIPGDTPISTPLGIFQLDEPLSLNTPPSTDEVRLVLNVSQEDKNPSGVLRAGDNGLEAAFHREPTGAVSIRAYILTEGESKWTELSGLSLLEEFSQPSTANSGYALLLRNDQEPYRSYLAAINAGETPTPFFVGLKIEGGIYDDRQLILAWPDIYDQLPDLPEVGGAGGNEGNAGADDKEDSSESGQRPNLPQTPDDNEEEQQPDPAPTPDDKQEEQQPGPAPDDKQEEQQPDPAPDDKQEEQPGPAPDDKQEEQPDPAPHNSRKQQQTRPASDGSGQKQQTVLTYTPEIAFAIPEIKGALLTDTSFFEYQSDVQGSKLLSGLLPNPPQTAKDTAGEAASNQEGISEPDPSSGQTGTGIKERENVPSVPDPTTAVEHTQKNDSHIPLLPLATAIAAGGCIGTAVCKASGNRLFYRITGKIKNILPK